MPKRKDSLKNPLPKKIIGLLLKKAMSKTDIAREIYNNPNARSGISKWIKLFLKEGLIKERATNSKSVLYTCNLDVLGDFNEQGYKFINLIIERFLSPLTEGSIESLKNSLLQTLMIKKVYAIQEKLFGYNPKKDFEFYQKNKTRFWKDKEFRNNFLDKIKQKERNLKRSKIFSFNWDYLFCCLLIPNNLINKIKKDYKDRNDPLFTTIKIFEDLNTFKKVQKI